MFSLFVIGTLLPSSSLAYTNNKTQFLTKDGLPSSTVFSVQQDQYGLMWFGTPSGFASFNGKQFSVFQETDDAQNSLPVRNSGNVFVDSQNRLWVGSWGQGIAIFDNKRQLQKHIDTSNSSHFLKSNKIQTFFESDDGSMWVGTNDGGITIFDQNLEPVRQIDTSSTPGQSLSDNRVWSIEQAQNGFIWVGTSNGINRIDTQSHSITHFVVSQDIPLNQRQIRALYIDSKQRLWVGTRETFGLFDETKNSIIKHMPKAHDLITVNKIRQGNDDDLMIATISGLFVFDRQNKVFKNSGESLTPQDDVRDILIDHSGIIWLATRGNGIFKSFSKQEIFQQFNQSENPNQLIDVWSMTASKSNVLWLGSSNGLYKLDSNSNTLKNVLPRADTPIKDRISALVEHEKDSLWIGTDTGLYVLSANTGELVDKSHLLHTNGVRSIWFMHSHLGRLWMSSPSEGVLLLSGPNQTEVMNKDTKPYGLTSNAITDITDNKEDTIFIGTQGNGINVVESSTKQVSVISTLTHEKLIDDTISSLLFDSRDNLWIGTPNGLSRLNQTTGHILNFTRQSGLPENEIKAIAEDKKGNIWLATSSKIVLIEANTDNVRAFKQQDGVLEQSFSRRSVAKNDGGLIFFGSDKGVLSINPNKLTAYPDLLPVVISSFKVNNQSVLNFISGNNELTLKLKYKQRNILFEFFLPEYTESQQNHYVYTLKGFEDEWQEADESFKARYTNLDPGSYEFQIKGKDSRGVETEQATIIAFVITPPFWETWIFRVSLLLLLISVITLLYKWRLQIYAAREAHLELKVAERTHALNEANQQLAVANEKLLHASYTDQLTGLRNRRFLEDVIDDDIKLLHRSLVSSPNSCLVFFVIDIDFFKKINDTYGHEGGDDLLRTIKPIFNQVFRESDHLIRWGGEEFLVVARNSERDMAGALATRLNEVFSHSSFSLNGHHNCHHTCSIGYAVYPINLKDYSAFSWQHTMQLADHALYQVKRNGRNGWIGIDNCINNENTSMPDISDLTNDIDNASYKLLETSSKLQND